MSMNHRAAGALQPHELILDVKQSYKRLEEDRLIRAVRKACKHIAIHHLPYRLSPVVLGVPGLLLHLTMLVSVYTFERAPWMYGLWIFSRAVHFCLDAMDGTQARRNGTQSTARHFWDHWVDVINASMAVLIVARLGPSQEVSFTPYLLLTATGQLFFYLGLCRYFATGFMREPYVNHLWNYVFCLFLGLSVCLCGTAILESPAFQRAYAFLSLVAFGFGLWALLRDVVLIHRSPLASLRFYARILLAPALIVCLYVGWLQHWSSTLSVRAMVALAMGSLAVSIHSRQLVNKPPAWLTVEGALLLLLVLLPWVPSPLHAALCHGVLALMVLAMVVGLLLHLRKMIQQYPEIGFPLVWLSSSHPSVSPRVSNKLAA